MPRDYYIKINLFKYPSVMNQPLNHLIDKSVSQLKICDYNRGGGGQGGLNLPLPVPFNPSSRPVFFGSRPFTFIRLRNIGQCCIISPFFSHFPLPWESRFPPPLLPPPVHLPPPFLPVSRPPVPPHITVLPTRVTYGPVTTSDFI